MKKITFLLVLVFGVMMFAGSAMAADAAWHFDLTVRQISQDSKHHRIYFEVEEGGYKNPHSCSKSSYYEVGSDGDVDRALSILLTAMVSGKKVKVHVSITKCGIYDQPVVDAVAIYK